MSDANKKIILSGTWPKGAYFVAKSLIVLFQLILASLAACRIIQTHTTQHEQKNMNNVILELKNSADFYTEFLAMKQSTIPAFFTPEQYGDDAPEIKMYNNVSALSFSMFEMLKGNLSNLINKHARRCGLFSGVHPYDQLSEAKAHFLRELEDDVKTGKVTFTYSQNKALSAIYLDNNSVIAATARELNLPLSAVKRLRDAVSKEAYRRYLSVQNGKAYNIAMGDCTPFLQNKPSFNPIEQVQEGDEVKACKGDLVRTFHSGWVVVSSDSQSDYVPTSSGLISAPYHRVKAQYADAFMAR